MRLADSPLSILRHSSIPAADPAEMPKVCPLPDLFAQKLLLDLPPRYAAYGRVCGNLIFQIAQAATRGEECWVGHRPSRTGEYLAIERANGQVLAVSSRMNKAPVGSDGVIRITGEVAESGLPAVIRQRTTRWTAPKPYSPALRTIKASEDTVVEVMASWRFTLRGEVRKDGQTVEEGLRAPQVGAIHAIKAHWAVSSEPATLVMPTGTGKTETMLGILVSEPVTRLLVVVPTDPLRDQISRKFASLGDLKAIGCLTQQALHPIVGILKRSPQSAEEVDEFFGRCHVVVATMAALARLPPELQSRVAQQTSHLFVDEAHHIAATTWKGLKRRFVERGRPVLQFTATPFRTDERRIDGKFIFVYPLRRAQEEGLFRKITYAPIRVTRRPAADIAIIQKVGETLDRDLARGFRHVAMARTDGIDEAEELLALYREHLPRHAAALVHSRMKKSQREDVLDDLRSGRTRIVVCVNMLGEGFDLPELKVAGLHDSHKSEAVTFQFVGRFTRARNDLGDPTVIASMSLEDPHKLLNALYREDADWNYLLNRGSAVSIEREKRRENLYSSFDVAFSGIPVETIAPRLSTFVFRTSCTRWDPQALVGLESRTSVVVEEPIISDDMAFAMMIMRKEERLRWTRVRSPTDVVYNLVMVHWDEEAGLLYVHSSSIEGIATQAAKLVAGDDVILLNGERVFRALHGFRRVMLNTLGVRETIVKPVRFQQNSGVNITEELERTQGNRTRIKTNLYGIGYVDEPVLDGEGGTNTQPIKRGIGCSIKGKIWSQEAVTHPGQWIEWCHTIGPKVSDDSIVEDAILRNILRLRRQHDMPEGKVPLAIEWPETFFTFDENRIDLRFDDRMHPLSECDLEIVRHDLAEGVRFRVRHHDDFAEFTLTIVDETAVYKHAYGPAVAVCRNRRERPIEEVFVEDPPAVRFADGDVLMGADLAAPPPDGQGYFDPAAIEALGWNGVNITQESQGPTRKSDTVQHRVIQRLLAAEQPYDIVFDGDASGEVADVIAIRRQGRVLDVELYHCKFSLDAKPGARVKDLYEVCGQAMKSVRWAGPEKRFLNRMRRQEESRLGRGGASRFQCGQMTTLDDWSAERREMTTRFTVVVVQPGYSKAKARPEHMPMLGSVSSYLANTYAIRFGFWASP